MFLPCLGIDVGKHKLYATLLLDPTKKPKRKTVSNNETGHQDLITWLRHHRVERVHACVEATSTYAHPIARLLHQQGAYGDDRQSETGEGLCRKSVSAH